MGELEKNIVRLLERDPGLSDRELTNVIRGEGASPQYVNQNCRQLETQGILFRKKREDGLIGNWLNISRKASNLVDRTEIEKSNGISEKKIKLILEAHLTSLGWQTKIARGYTHGIDIEAKKGISRWIIEVKSIESTSPLPVNSFVSVLGEIIQRMDDPDCKYSIALPDIQQFRRLWGRLPLLAKSKLGITALFIDARGIVTETI